MQYLFSFFNSLLTPCNYRTQTGHKLQQNSYSSLKNKNRHQTAKEEQGKKNLALFILFVLVIGLSILAFTPGETLLPHSLFRGLIFDSLHFPAVFILYFVLREFISQLKTIILIMTAIISVEIIQLYTGRSSSLIDIAVGSTGLISAIILKSNFKGNKPIAGILIMCCWIMPSGYLFYLKNDFINSFPNIDQFEKPSARRAWEAVINGDTPSSKVVFIKNKDDKTRMDVTKDQEHYWGVHINLLKESHVAIPDKFYICASANQTENLQIRIDDQRMPTYFERINIELPVSTKKTCRTYVIADEIQKVKKNNYDFQQSKITKVGLFMGPESKADTFTIYDARFTN